MKLELLCGKVPVREDWLYWCSFCPRRMRGRKLLEHLEHFHADVVATAPGGVLEFVSAPPERHTRKHALRDLPGQTLFGFGDKERA